MDVVVTDKAGKPVTGLQAQDFTLLDDKTPRKIVSFQAFDGATVKPDRPTEVILLFDYVNDNLQNIAAERREVQAFLQENGGHLAQPVTIFVQRDAGLQALRGGQPSLDGNLLAEAVAKMESSQQVNGSATGANGDGEKYGESLHALSGLIAYESKRPGRKLLLWIGPGWPLLDSQHFVPSNNDLKQYFKSIVDFSTGLREARINVYSVGVGSFHVQSARGGSGNKSTNNQNAISTSVETDEAAKAGTVAGMGGASSLSIGSSGTGLTGNNTASFVETSDISSPLAYLDHLKGVKQFPRASAANVAVKVLALQNGGRVLGLDNGLKSQIDSCIQDAGAFYTISFDPAHASQPNEYHDLKLEIDKPGLTAHTSTGYYNQP
jgi:VWFA-related protein